METTGKDDLMIGKYMNNHISWFQGYVHFTLSAKLLQLSLTL